MVLVSSLPWEHSSTGAVFRSCRTALYVLRFGLWSEARGNLSWKNGDRFPALGFGTWKLTGEECYEAVRAALDAGYLHLDTAETYDKRRR